jgi:beta-lactamase regulating signal transducer with metallopeptidase domain
MMGALWAFGVPYACALVGTWLLTYWCHSTLLLLGTRLLLAPRVADRRVADVLWKAALCAGVVTASIALATSSRPALGRYEASAVLEERMWTHALLPDEPLPTIDGARGTMAPSATRDGRVDARVPTPLSPLRYLPAALVLLWIGYATVRIVRVVRATTRARRELGLRLALPAEDDARFRRVVGEMGHRRAVRFTVSEALTSPIALGRGEITIPRRMLTDLSDDDQCSVVAHEVAHLVRRDPWWLLATVAVESLFFFQPLNRMARVHWQDNAEYLCDALVARRRGMALSLARGLARIAEWLDAERPLFAPALAEPSTSLVGRVRALLDEAPAMRRPATRRMAIAYTSVAAASGLLVLPVAVLALAPIAAAGSARGWGTGAFAWSGVVPPGSAIEIQGLLGNIHAEPTDSDVVAVHATRHGRAPTPDVHFVVVRHAGGVTICAVYPPPAGAPANRCIPGTAGMINSRSNDVEVEFAVRVPRGVLATLTTANGRISTGPLESVVNATTMTGDIDVATSAFASAHSQSGDVRVSMGRMEWAGSLRLSSFSGNVRVTLPDDARVELTAETRTGTIESDFGIGHSPPSRLSRLKPTGSLGSSVQGVIGATERRLALSTLSGNIQIRRRAG